MIYELMNRKYYKDKGITVICDHDKAVGFAIDILTSGEEIYYETGFQEIVDTLRSNEHFLCTKNVYDDNKIEYFIEPLYNSKGKQFFVVANNIWIQKDLVKAIDLDKISSDEINIISANSVQDTENAMLEIVEELIEEYRSGDTGLTYNDIICIATVMYDMGCDYESYYMAQEECNMLKRELLELQNKLKK